MAEYCQRLTIDGAGRVVVPKALRDAMQLRRGSEIDIALVDGRLQIDVPTVAVTVRAEGDFRVAVPEEQLPTPTRAAVRDVLEATRR
ncbi:MAG: AbrB/MazE/SpoVT family DNA-binding domain-containing protein [Nocardioides sp.]